jgi:Tol biopolymer transport system component
MGEVYRARDAKIGRDVALKILPSAFSDDPGRLRRFEQEIRLAGQLSHPNILVIYDVGMHEGVAYFVAELLDGNTLRERLLRGAISLREAVDYGMQLAKGLAAAHVGGVLHRDLKPENVFITRDNRVKILDFGLAKALASGLTSQAGSEGPTATGTVPGTIMGTVGYMSPEQVRGEAVDQRADIFAYGAILYEMFLGQRAFQGASPAETLSQILRDDPPGLVSADKRLPAPIGAIVSRCLEKGRENRFDSARDIAFFLSSHLASADDEEVVMAPSMTREARLGKAKRISTVASLEFSRLTFRRGLILVARFAPDSRTIYYGAAWDGQPFRVFSLRSERLESVPLPLPDASLLAISAAGELAVLLRVRTPSPVLLSGTLGRVSIVGGTPRELAENVKWADWSPDGSALAVARRLGSRDQVEYPLGSVLFETEGRISQTRVAPDGESVAFLHHVLNGYVNTSVEMVSRTGERRTLSTGGISTNSLAWSPDGKEVLATGRKSLEANELLAFSLNGEERLLYRSPVPFRIHDVSRDGRALMTTDAQRVGILAKVHGDEQERDLSWFNSSNVSDISDDGSLLLFNERPEYGAGAAAGIYLRKTDGSPAVKLGEGIAFGLSPKNEWALSLSRGDPNGVVLLPVGAGEPRAIPMNQLVPEWATWLPDGKHLLVQARDPGKQVRVYLQDLDGNEPRPVSPNGIRLAGTSAAAPDGRSFLARRDDRSICRFDIAGNVEEIRGLSSGERVIRWTFEGDGLYVFRPGEMPCSVFCLNLATGHRQVWKTLVPPDPAGVLSVQALRITPDGKSYAYSFWSVSSDLHLVDELF